LLAARLDTRQGQFLAEDGGHLLHGQLDLEDMAARLVAGAAAGLLWARAQRLTGLPVPLSHSAGALGPIAELGNVDLRQRDGHQVLALLADHLATADVLGQIALDLAADELAEALVVAFNLLSHGEPPIADCGLWIAD